MRKARTGASTRAEGSTQRGPSKAEASLDNEVAQAAAPAARSGRLRLHRPLQRHGRSHQNRQKVTIPSGTNLAVRLVDAIDSETAQAGQSFGHARFPLSIDGDVVIPSGYDVTGHVVDIKSAGNLPASLKLILSLIESCGSKSYNIQTNRYQREGSSRGKNTAAKVGRAQPWRRHHRWHCRGW